MSGGMSDDQITGVSVSNIHMAGLLFVHDGRAFNVNLDYEAGRTLQSISSQLNLDPIAVVKLVLAVIEAERSAR
jgi:hypothetical protein